MDQRISNHDALVGFILERMGSLSEFKKEVLRRTGRRYITRMTVDRAFKTAGRYALGNDVYLPTLQIANVNNKLNITPKLPSQEILEKIEAIGGENICQQDL
jgi:hypothetical protein